MGMLIILQCDTVDAYTVIYLNKNMNIKSQQWHIWLC